MDNSRLQCSEGIVLHMVPYRNYDQILTVFTLNEGVLKLFCKKGQAQWQRYPPLTKVEFVYREKNSEIFACEEITLLESYLDLRKNFLSLQSACDLIRSIYVSQLVGKAAPLLYQLLTFYLAKIPHVKDPVALVLSFKLKILKHEGLLDWENEAYRLKQFTQNECALLHILAHSQSYQQLAQLNIPAEFKIKVERLFKYY